MYANEAGLVVSPVLYSVLAKHFEDWMRDDYNRKVNEEPGYFIPHFELIEEELREEGLDDTSQYRELDALIDLVGNGELKVYLQ